MDKEEYDLIAYIAGSVTPKALSDDEADKIEAEWVALTAEAERRGESWSLADLIAEGFRPTAA